MPESGGGPSSSSAPRRAIPPGELQRIERLLGDLDIAYLDAEDLLKLRGVLEALHAPLGGREATLDRIMAVEMRILADLTRREAGEA